MKNLLFFLCISFLCVGCGEKKYQELASIEDCKNMIYLDGKMKRAVSEICFELYNEISYNKNEEFRQSLLCMREKLNKSSYPNYRSKILRCAKKYNTVDTNDFVNYLFETTLSDIDD
jgi:hypothetical protein